MAVSEIYVDPSLASDTGDGSIGTPYGDLEYAIEQTTFDTTNGTRVNIKAGTDEVLAAQLATAMADTGTTAAWAPSATAPCIFQGYTSAAGDGGQGGISGGGSVAIIDGSALDYVTFRDLHLHNSNTDLLDIDNNCAVINCELNNASGFAVRFDTDAVVVGNYIHDIGGAGGIETFTGLIAYNYLADGDKRPVKWIDVSGATTITRNVINVGDDTIGIEPFTGSVVSHNDIYSSAGTGSGISLPNSVTLVELANNIISGFSGSGGVGIAFGTGNFVATYRANSVYDCATEFDTSPVTIVEEGNEILSESPFTDPDNADFSPVDTGSLSEGGLPQIIGGGLV